MYMEEFTNKTNLYKAKTFGTTQFLKSFQKNLATRRLNSNKTTRAPATIRAEMVEGSGEMNNENVRSAP